MDRHDLETQWLLTYRPRSHSPGTFPKDYLPTGEVVLFEARPALAGFITPTCAGAFVLAFFGAVVWFLAGQLATGVPGGTTTEFWELVGGVVIFSAVAAIVSVVVRWYYTTYAITNKRILRKSGVTARQIIDARFEKFSA